VLDSPLFGNILFIGVVYSHETTDLIHIGLAKSLKMSDLANHLMWD
jgi:hypothetical protein